MILNEIAQKKGNWLLFLPAREPGMQGQNQTGAWSPQFGFDAA
jgi:hypothetical protein